MDAATSQNTFYRTGKSSRGAVVRQVTRRDGKPSWIRIDDAENAVGDLHFRSVNLEDYVAQIRSRQLSERTERARPDAGQSANDVAEVSASSAAIEAMEVVAKIDSGFAWLEQANRDAAEQDARSLVEFESKLNDKVDQQVAFRKELAQEIAVAIAEVLVDKTAAAEPATVKEEPSTATPDLGRILISARSSLIAEDDEVFVSNTDVAPEPIQEIFPIAPTSDQAGAEEVEQEDFDDDDVSLSVAAWAVPRFACPEVVSRLIGQPAMMRAADNCEKMLTPFGKTIAVTSPRRGTGVTTTALAIGQVLARSGRRTLLIDANLENNGLSRQVGLNKISWLPVVDPIGESIVQESESGLCVMPLNLESTNGFLRGISTLDLLEMCLGTVCSEFDVVIIDAGNVDGMVNGLLATNQLIDAVVLVSDDVQADDFREARESLIRHGVYKFVAANNAFRGKAA